MRAAAFTPDSMSVTASASGCGMRSSSMIFSKQPRSSALRMASQSVPMMGTPSRESGSARLMAVCPPSDTTIAFGFSRWMTFITSSTISGSK